MNDLTSLSESKLIDLEQKTRAKVHGIERLIKQLENTMGEIEITLCFLWQEKKEKEKRNKLVMKELIKRRKEKDGFHTL